MSARPLKLSTEELQSNATPDTKNHQQKHSLGVEVEQKTWPTLSEWKKRNEQDNWQWENTVGQIWLPTNSLRRIPLNVRAISAENIYQKTTHSTVTF